MEDRLGKLGALVSGTALGLLVSAAEQSLLRHHPLWTLSVLALLLLLGICLMFHGSIRSRWEGVRAAHREKRRRAAGIGQLWRHTSDSTEVSLLAHLKEFAMPGLSGGQPPRPFSRCGAMVGCKPLPSDTAVGHIAQVFLEMLSCPAVSGLVSALADIPEDALWSRHAGNGLHRLEAVLAGRDGRVVAAAALILPVTGFRGHGMPNDSAFLALHAEVVPQHGNEDPARSLSEWFSWLVNALSLPAALDMTLTRAGLTVTGAPAACIGVAWHAPTGIAELVDVGDLPLLPGRGVSSEFLTWAVADPSGATVAAAAQSMLRQLCEHTLHVSEDYELLLDRLVATGPLSSPLPNAQRVVVDDGAS